MNQDKLKKLHELEEKIAKLNEQRVRASERLSMLRQQRDGYIKELEQLGIDPKEVSKKLTKMQKEIDDELTSIENQIPLSLRNLLENVKTN